MVAARPVAGGGRAVEIAPERLAGWFDRFGARHGGIAATRIDDGEVTVRAADGTTAAVEVPFGPLAAPDGEHEGLLLEPLLAHLLRPRRIGLVLVRLGAHSVGIVRDGLVLVSATDRHLVHGRAAAGGWSQQRFARRREGQARQAIAAAVSDTVRVLLPRVAELDGVVLGGDRRALAPLRAEPRLSPLMAIAAARVLDIGEPRRSVLDDAAERVRAVEIVVREPT